MTNEQFEGHILKVTSEFKGDISHLSSAIGALVLGRMVGWKVVRITTSSVNYRRHQKILGLDFKAVLPESTDLSQKSVGYRIAVHAGNFWKVVEGVLSIDKEHKFKFE